jgi:hypothetical protein
MSLVKRITTKDYGFGQPFNGLPWNDNILDDTPIAPISFNPSEAPGSLFSLTGRGAGSFSYSGHADALHAYKKCPPLSSIINRKAQAHINGKTWIMAADGKESMSAQSKKLRKLLAKPNPLQSWKQFEAQQKIYMQLFGFCIVLPIIPAGFEKYGPVEATSIWNIPPYMVDITETSKLWYQTDLAGIVQHVKLNYKGVQTDLPLTNLGIFKDFIPSFNTMVLPESRVCLLEKPINNIIAALESENEIISYAGSQGIITPDNGGGQYVNVAMSPEEKTQLQLDFKRQYGIRRGQFRYIISPAAIKWQSMGTDPRKLMLIEFIAENSVEICNGYAMPPFLLGLRDSTFNNQNTAEKGWYQNSIIPESDSVYEEWNLFFRTAEWGDRMEKDFSHLPILQEDAGAKATARDRLTTSLEREWLNNMITANEWRLAMDMDTVAGWDVYYSDWVKEGKSFGKGTPTTITQTQPTNA